jgi:hypothetical protein
MIVRLLARLASLSSVYGLVYLPTERNMVATWFMKSLVCKACRVDWQICNLLVGAQNSQASS